MYRKRRARPYPQRSASESVVPEPELANVPGVLANERCIPSTSWSEVQMENSKA